MASVNRPTDTATKEKDINQKLQLYGIYSAFANGKVPSNKQIDVALNSALSSKALGTPSKKLSSEGQELVGDLKEVIRQAKNLLLTKNSGNLLQDFIWDCQHLDGAGAKLPGAPVDKQTAQQHGNEALDGLKTLGTLMLSNGQFRKLLNDATVLLRDMAGDAAANTANKVRPSEDQLNQIDQPAEDNTWHEVPDLSKGNLKQQATDAYNKNKPFNRQDVQNAAQEGTNTAQSQPTADNQEAGQVGAGTAADRLKQQARSNIPDETQQKAKDAKNIIADKSRNYMREKMPQERREQSIWRLKKMVVEIQGHSDYQQAIETLLSLAENYAGHAKTVGGQGTQTVKGAHEDNNLQRAETNLKTLIERFANSTSSDDFFDALNNIYRDADKDPELKDWFKRLDRYVRKCLQEQGYILQDQSTEEWNQIYEKGHYLLRERYREHTDRILDEVKYFGQQFDEDPQNRAFGAAVQKLFLDLGQDKDGKATFKPHLVKDLTEVIIPGIFENTRYVPIPRIEVSDPMIDAIVENLVIESDNLFPNVVEFGSDNYWRMGRKQVKSKTDNKVTVAASGIQMDLRDVAYYVKKKQGFPSVTDKGVMDIFMGGDGFSFKLVARNAQKSERAHFVVVEKVDVTVKNLNIKVKQSNHKLLFAIAKPLLLKVMKPVIQKVIEKQIRSAFEQGDAYAWAVHQDAQKAVEASKNDPENATSIMSNYTNAWKNKMLEKKKKAEEVTKDTKVNVAVTKQDSMFKNISLPGGISTKATEYKDLAAKGDRWESPVFGIGSAKESTDVPKLTQVQRRGQNPSSGGNQLGSTSNGALGATSGALGATSGANQLGSTNTGAFGANSNTLGGQTGQTGQFTSTNQSGLPDFSGKNDTAGYNGTATSGNAQGMYHDTVTQH